MLHVAAAEALGTDLGMVVAYDQRFVDRSQGIEVAGRQPTVSVCGAFVACRHTVGFDRGEGD
jgi:hypothetical protein